MLPNAYENAYTSRVCVAAILTCVFLVVSCPLACGQDRALLVGVLEDNPGHFGGESHYRRVRAAFYRKGERWMAFPTDCSDQNCLKTIAEKYPRQVRWTIAFDGLELGTVESRTPDAFDSYSGVGQQVITSTNVLPTVRQPSQEFGGFLGEALYRPLIAVSQPNYLDPDGWKPAKLPAAVTRGIRQEFRKRFPRVRNCEKRQNENAMPWPYEDVDISIRKTYASKRGWFIAEVLLSPYRCDGPPDNAFTSQWFVVSPQRDAHLLDSGMWLVDAGDYDGDGKSELVFAIDGYDHGGYRIYYHDFRQHAVFEFSYH